MLAAEAQAQPHAQEVLAASKAADAAKASAADALSALRRSQGQLVLRHPCLRNPNLQHANGVRGKLDEPVNADGY